MVLLAKEFFPMITNPLKEIPLIQKRLGKVIKQERSILIEEVEWNIILFELNRRPRSGPGSGPHCGHYF